MWVPLGHIWGPRLGLGLPASSWFLPKVPHSRLAVFRMPCLLLPQPAHPAGPLHWDLLALRTPECHGCPEPLPQILCLLKA